MISIGDNVRIDDFVSCPVVLELVLKFIFPLTWLYMEVWESQLKIIQVYRQGLQFIVLLMILEEII